MFLVPYQRTAVESPFSCEKAAERVSAAVDPHGSIFHCDRAFYGSVSKDGFQLVLAAEGKQVSPHVYGKFVGQENGTAVDLVFCPNPFGLLLGVALVLLVFFSEFSKGVGWERSVAETITLLFFADAVLYFGFRRAVRDANRLLCDLLGKYD